MINDSDPKEEDFKEYVLMPWNDKAQIIVEPDSHSEKIVLRWEFIQNQLNQNKKILNVTDLIHVIKSYNVVFDESLKQLQKPWKFTALIKYFDEVGENGKNDFFKEGGTLSIIRSLCLQCKDLVPKVKLLKSGFRSCVDLHQLQIAALLANAFLCTYPERDSDYPSINFNKLFEGVERGNVQPYVEKIKCIVHYFERINEKQPTGNVSFHRLCILDHKLPRWDKTTATLSKLQVEIQGKIEDQEGFLQMDFANRFVGGGVLGRGCVQEEIRFVICPELIAARLFTQCLADNEALLVIGAERYSTYTGFSDTFKFAGDYRDATPFDDTKHRKTYLIVLDALYFSHTSEQYRESKILRELKKAYVGFKAIAKSCSLPLATGNWGCGAFRGDPQLKSVVQLMASSQAQRDVLYLTFGDSSLKKQIDDLYKLLKECDINVGTLYRIIRLYNRNKNQNQTLFSFIHETIANQNKKANSGKSFFVGGHRRDPQKTDQEESRSKPSCGKPLVRNAEMDVDCGIVEKRLRKCTQSTEGQPLADEASSAFPAHGFWSRNIETGENKPNVEAERKPKDCVIDLGEPTCADHEDGRSSPVITEDVEMSEIPSPSFLSKIEVASRMEKKREEIEDEIFRLSGEPLKSETHHEEDGNGPREEKNKSGKLVQLKITDCFFKG